MSNEELVSLIQEGRCDLMPQLWDNVIGLVRKYAYKLCFVLEGRRGLTVDDLIQTGYIALTDAVSTYTPGVAAFSTWFVYYLKKRFWEAAGLHGKAKIKDPINNARSLDAPLDDEDGGTLAEIIPDPKASATIGAVEDQIWVEQLREVLGEMMREMPEAYADTLYRRYWKDQTYAEAAEELGIAGNTVKQREHKGLRYLRLPVNRSRLASFYEFDCYSGTGLGTFKKSGRSVQERYMEWKFG